MNAPLILQLVGLRYKLLWAQTRTRNGRIALFLSGYLFAVLIMILMTAGGIGAAMIAVRSGQAKMVAQAVLGGLFVNALIASVVTGFGINTAFTDGALRRYALSAGDRMAARHLTGILEPVWIFVLALDMGLVTGMYAFGAGRFWVGTVAVLLLLIADYLVARVLATLIEWLSHVKGGTAVLFVMLIGACMLPGLLIPRLAHAHGARETMMAALHYTPPFAAAALTMKAAAEGMPREFGLLAVWIAALLVALAAIEKQAARPRSAAAVAATWDHRYERIASIFGPSMAPLVGRTLRYYVRSNKVRFNYIAAIPMLTFMTFNKAGEGGPQHYFVRALGAFAIIGFLGTAVMSTNQFGFGFPALFPAADRTRGDPARVELHGALRGRLAGGGGADAVDAVRAGSLRSAHGTDAAGDRCGRTVPVQRAVVVDLAAGGASHQFRNHLRQSALVGRQRVADRRAIGSDSRRCGSGSDGKPGCGIEPLVGADACGGGGCRVLRLLIAGGRGRVCQPQGTPAEYPGRTELIR